MVNKEDVIVTISKEGYIKRTSLRSYNATKSDTSTMKEGDELVAKLQLDTLQTLVMFTNRGSFIYLPVFKFLSLSGKILVNTFQT